MKLTEEILEELIVLESEVKERQKRIDEIKRYCKEKGSFSTRNYVCLVTEMVRRSLAPLDDVIHTIGEETLREHDLIRETAYKVVRVREKGLELDV